MIHRYLPETIPLFPLTGTLLLPGMWLPLNVFETRYCEMVSDALEGTKVIGMIQPLVPQDDNRGLTVNEKASATPELYPIGCLGSIKDWKQGKEGGYHISLIGLSRFRLVEEITELPEAPSPKNYRLARVDYKGFDIDQAEPVDTVNTKNLLNLLTVFGKENQIPYDISRLETVAGAALVNGLAMSLPFAAAEKQALLEVEALNDREELLCTLMGMGLQKERADVETPPTVN